MEHLFSIARSACRPKCPESPGKRARHQSGKATVMGPPRSTRRAEAGFTLDGDTIRVAGRSVPRSQSWICEYTSWLPPRRVEDRTDDQSAHLRFCASAAETFQFLLGRLVRWVDR